MKKYSLAWIFWFIIGIVLLIIIWNVIKDFEFWRQMILIADVLIPLGITLLFYSALLYLVIFILRGKNKITQRRYELENIKGKFAISLGVICQGIGFFLNSRYGLIIGDRTWVTSGYLELITPPDEPVPSMLSYGIIFGILIITFFYHKKILGHILYSNKK